MRPSRVVIILRKKWRGPKPLMANSICSEFRRLKAGDENAININEDVCSALRRVEDKQG
jgi:hypothetical protein